MTLTLSSDNLSHVFRTRDRNTFSRILTLLSSPRVSVKGQGVIRVTRESKHRQLEGQLKGSLILKGSSNPSHTSARKMMVMVAATQLGSWVTALMEKTSGHHKRQLFSRSDDKIESNKTWGDDPVKDQGLLLKRKSVNSTQHVFLSETTTRQEAQQIFLKFELSFLLKLMMMLTWMNKTLGHSDGQLAVQCITFSCCSHTDSVLFIKSFQRLTEMHSLTHSLPQSFSCLAFSAATEQENTEGKKGESNSCRTKFWFSSLEGLEGKRGGTSSVDVDAPERVLPILSPPVSLTCMPASRSVVCIV